MIYMEHLAKKRYFMLVLEQDMLGSWLLKSLYGSVITRSHGSKLEVFESEKSARDMMFEHENTKRQRGYVYAQYPLEFIFDLIPQTLQEVVSNESKPVGEKMLDLNVRLTNEDSFLNDQLQLGFS